MAKKTTSVEKKKRPRTCVACGQESPKRALLRVVKTSDGHAVYDPTGKADGRGAYVCCSSECIKMAKKKKSFSKALKVETDDELYQQLDKVCMEKNNG